MILKLNVPEVLLRDFILMNYFDSNMIRNKFLNFLTNSMLALNFKLKFHAYFEVEIERFLFAIRRFNWKAFCFSLICMLSQQFGFD